MNAVRLIPLFTMVLFASGNAQAAFNVSLNINQADPLAPKTWNEDITNLVALSADGSFNLKTNVTSGGNTYFQNGIFSSTAPSTSVHPDYWTWTPDTTVNGGHWNWHSLDTVTPTTSAPWMTEVNLNNTLGHKTQDINYDYSAQNNTAQTQTYTFSVVEDLNPAVSNPSSVFNQFKANFASNSGSFLFNPTNPTGAQQFLLSADGINWVDAGIDVGGIYSTAIPNALESRTGAGPAGGPWKMMKLQTSFTLGSMNAAALNGLATITPIPEPDSYAMFVAGLGLLGFVANRRSKRKAQ